MSVSTGKQPNSEASIAFDLMGGGKEEHKVRNSRISFDKPLQYNGFHIYAEEKGAWERIDIIINEYLDSLRAFLKVYYSKLDEA